MTEKQIATAIINKYGQYNKMIIRNIYYYDWESDILMVGRDNLITEIEIKCGKYDYLADFKKGKKHKIISGEIPGDKPNFFTYAVDTKFIDEIEIPEYAGLIIMNSTKYGIGGIRKYITQLHQEPMNPQRWEKLATSLYYKIY